MSDADLRNYIQQMLRELAELADDRAEDVELGEMAFKMRLLAGKGPDEDANRASALH